MFDPGEKVPLEHVKYIGVSFLARVDKVRCRRILLARKSMVTTTDWTLKDAMNEVEHLHRLRRSHIVQLVGSYLQHKDFAILLYPAADCDLTEFMNHWTMSHSRAYRTVAYVRPDDEAMIRIDSLSNFFGCLAHALAYVHQHTTRHCDIKPWNILVKLRQGQGFHVYLADFGISSSFVSQDQSQTESSRAKTLRYCAPEGFDDGRHGRSANVFSLGCVYSEMLTVLAGSDLDDFADWRRNGKANDYFCSSIPRVSEWVEMQALDNERAKVSLFRSLFIWDDEITSTIARFPSARPTAESISRRRGHQDCCEAGLEGYIAE